MTIDNYLNKLALSGKEPNVLPIFHTTSSEILLQKICPMRQLKAPESDSPNGKIVYLFYGNSKFESDDDLNTKYNIANRPVTLMYKYDAFTPRPVNLVPFDTGGLDYYLQVAPREVDLADYAIPYPTRETYQKLTLTLYGNNANYIKAQLAVRDDTLIICPPFQFIRALYQRYKDKYQDTAFDKRAFTFEVQFRDENDIAANPICMFVPSAIDKSEEYKQHLRERFTSDLEIISYKDFVNDKLRRCYDKMQNKVIEYLRQHYLK